MPYSLPLLESSIISINNSISMLVSPYLIDATTQRIQKIKSRSNELLEISLSPLDFQLEQMMTLPLEKTLSSTYLQAIPYLYNQCKSRSEGMEQMQSMLMTSIEMAIEWMSKSQTLESSIMRAEEQKEEDERRMKESLNDYSIRINKLSSEKADLESEINEIDGAREYFKKLYEEEIGCTSELLLINSSGKIGSGGYLGGWSRRMDDSISKSKYQSEEEDRNGYLHDIIRELRCQNTSLREEIRQLRSALIESSTAHKVTLGEETNEDCMAFIPTQNSVVYEDKHSLASEILQLGKKLSDMRDSGCFSYLIKQNMGEKAITELDIASFQRSRVFVESTERTLVESIIVKGKEESREKGRSMDEASGLIGFVTRLLQRMVTDRIRKH